MNTDLKVLSDAWDEIHFAHGSHMQLHEATLEQFAYGALMRLPVRAANTAAAYGLVIQYSQHAYIKIHFLKQENWVLAIESTGLLPVINHVLPLSLRFDPTLDHSLTIEQQQEQTLIYLDGNHVLGFTETARPARPGIMTYNTAATFHDIQQIDLLAICS
ncbi:MAG TPA: hypothetical protein VL461_12915 [Dictyobacter sp.]|jgi:hypothetical protein|nr:hypothetical protein [Dictyobacter sp.]